MDQRGLACEVADPAADGGKGETKKRLKATLTGASDTDFPSLLWPKAGQAPSPAGFESKDGYVTVHFDMPTWQELLL